MYRLLYYLVNVLIRVFYRKLYVNGLDNIDKSKTYLITSNHPNGFFEPLIMACTFPIDLHFMVRGDMFENYWMDKFLRSTHQIPIYRFVDGYAKMKENQSSLMEATKKLSEGNSILVFAEGSTEALMKCRPIQKGTAKMAFQTFEEYPDTQLEILPVGINFENWWHPGGESICNIGKSFSANEYLDIESRPKAITEMTRRIEKEMKSLILHVEDKENEDVVRKYWQLANLTQPLFPRKSQDNRLYRRIKTISDLVNNDPTHIVINDINKIYQPIQSQSSIGRILGVKRGWPYLLLPFTIPGIIFHAIPVSIGYYFRKNKVKRDAFAAPILGIVSFLISVVFYVLWLIVGSIILGPLKATLILACIVASGFAFILFWENTHKISPSKLSIEFHNSVKELQLKVDQLG